MSEYTSYYLYQRYEKRGDQPWLPSYPNTLSIDGGGTMPLVVKEEDDPECGYVPPLEPIYRWVDLDPTQDWFCSDCDTKVYGVRNSGETFSVQCNDNPTLTSGDVSGITDIEYILIGDCVTSIGNGALSGQTSLQGVTMPPSISGIGTSAFYGNAAMTDCAIPQSVETIGASAFTNCVSLQNVMLWDSITSIGASAFYNCDYIISIHIPSGLTAITESCFFHCGALSEINIPNNVKSIGNTAFIDCTSLFEVSIGSGVTSIGNNAFNGCSGLTRITCLAPIPPTLGSSVFDNTNNCYLMVPCGMVEVYQTASGWSNYASRIIELDGCPQYRWYTVSTFCDGYDKYAHQKKQYSTDGVTWIDVSPLETQDVVVEYYSSDCISPSFTGKYFAAYTGGAVSSAECDASSAITSGEIHTHSALTNFIIGECVTSLNERAFSGCNNLVSIIIPDNVTSIGKEAFRYCRSLTSITIPNSVTSISDGVFYGCSGLTSVTIPNSVTSIGGSAFYLCTSLTEVTIGSWVTSIGRYAFAYCSGLTSVTIGNGVRSIGNSAFYYCSGLTSVIIPSGVTSIGGSAFADCSSLTSITVLATTPPSCDYSFIRTNNCPIFVLAESVNAYKTADGWGQYSSRIQPITN